MSVGWITAALSAGRGLLPGQMQAPESCYFPPGTGVSRAGVSAVATLGLTETAIEAQDPPGGTVYVTTGRVSRFEGEAPTRMWCVDYDEDFWPGARFAAGPGPHGWTLPGE